MIDSGIYELDRRNGEDSYEKLFQIGGEYSPEIIFCIMGIKDLYTNSRINIYILKLLMEGGISSHHITN